MSLIQTSDRAVRKDVLESPVPVLVDHNPAIFSEYGIMSIPTLALFKNGRIVRKTVGVQSKAHLMGMLREFM
ncbi:thioredoxin family protein [Paenibacillus contaminans]|uniref:Thioredoxin domain-containing protein n=1 Tax=Paenibacillus contaminans TaxID=450362 RepID=A0A329M6D2_9BACL|nr:thioredoxin domain-containing protein [Paenibacillus contaminans]RAV15318.1 hypothetical protein DQG23_30425 [Paenibacillus contaminans]